MSFTILTEKNPRRFEMSLVLAPVQLEDFDEIESHADTYEPGDDLVAPPYPVAWPVTTRTAAKARLRFAMAKQRRRFRDDPTARYIKVVDNASGQIVSMARWHFFSSGYDFASMIHWEMAERLPGEDWPQDFNYPAHDFILRSRDAMRKDWIGEGRPAWLLMHMVTRASHRGRGAAAMLIKWGIERSEESGVPAYLEAGAQGRPIYTKYGFQQVGDLIKLDLRPHGVEIVFELANMARYPQGWAQDLERHSRQA